MTRYPCKYLSIVMLLGLSFLGCSEKIQNDNSLWGGRGTSDTLNDKHFLFFWQVSGYKLPIKPNSLKKGVKAVQWQYAVVLVAQEQHEKPSSFSFADFSFTPNSFSVEKKVIDFSNIDSQKLIFYTDELGNVRQLAVDHDNFDFFTKYSTENATPNDVINFWKELQKNNNKSIVFWENEKNKIPTVGVQEVSPALNPPESDPISGENPEAEQVDAKKPIDEPIEM